MLIDNYNNYHLINNYHYYYYDVQGAVSLDKSREQPHDGSVGIHDSVRYHVVVELVSSATIATSTCLC